MIQVEIMPYSEMIENTLRLQGEMCNDPEDIKFLECAVSGKADLVVSGDRDLLSLKEIENIRIVTPNELRNLIS